MDDPHAHAQGEDEQPEMGMAEYRAAVALAMTRYADSLEKIAFALEVLAGICPRPPVGVRGSHFTPEDL